MDENKKFAEWVRENITKWSGDGLKSLLSKLKLKVSGTKHELVHRLLPFQKDNDWLEKHVKEIINSFKFKKSMDKTMIPPPSDEWTADSPFYPKVTTETISYDRDAKASKEKPKECFFFQENKNGSSYQSRGLQ